MFLHTVLRTKIIPPPRGLRTLPRRRVSQTLNQAFDYRLTILQAGAGYGKSTALAELSEETQSIVWYQVSDEDNDPLVFLLHMCHAILQALPDIQGLPTVFLESWNGEQGPLPWRGLLDQIINSLSNHLAAPALLILDDAHHVSVIGLTDEKWGEVGKACVVLKPGQSVTEGELLAHMQEHLARYKVPKSVSFMDALPLSSMGKILKRELRDQFR